MINTVDIVHVGLHHEIDKAFCTTADDKDVKVHTKGSQYCSYDQEV